MLRRFRFKVIFRVIDVSSFAFAVQKFLFESLALLGFFVPSPPLSRFQYAQCESLLDNQASDVICLLLVVESFFCSVLVSVLLRPSQSALFNSVRALHAEVPSRIHGTRSWRLSPRRRRASAPHRLEAGRRSHSQIFQRE